MVQRACRAVIDNHVRVIFTNGAHRLHGGIHLAHAGLDINHFRIWDVDLNFFLRNSVNKQNLHNQ